MDEYDRMNALCKAAVAQFTQHCAGKIGYEKVIAATRIHHDELMQIAHDIYAKHTGVFDKDLSHAKANDIQDNWDDRVAVQMEFVKEALLFLMNRKLITEAA